MPVRAYTRQTPPHTGYFREKIVIFHKKRGFFRENTRFPGFKGPLEPVLPTPGFSLVFGGLFYEKKEAEYGNLYL